MQFWFVFFCFVILKMARNLKTSIRLHVQPSAEFDMKLVISDVKGFLAETPPSYRISQEIDPSELGFSATASGKFYLKISSKLSDKFDGQRTVEFQFLSSWIKAQEDFNIDAVLRIPDGGWEEKCQVTQTDSRNWHTQFGEVLFTKEMLQGQLLDPRKAFLKANTLTLQAHLKLTQNFDQNHKVSSTDAILARLASDQWDLLRSQTGSDYTLISCDGHAFPVHRAILSARSPVFAAMLQHEFLEKKTGENRLEDVGRKALEVLLEFIYSGSVSRVSETAETLLAAADKYSLLDLKQVCENHLASGVTVANAALRLILADKHGCTTLKTTVIEFLKKDDNRVAFVDIGGMKEISLYNDLEAEVLDAFSSVDIALQNA